MREAVLSVSDDDLAAAGIGELVAHCRAAGLCELEELDCRGDGGVVLATVAEPLDPDLLDALDYVESWDRVAAPEGREELDDPADPDDPACPDDSAGPDDPSADYRYRVAFTAPSIPESAREPSSELVGTCDPDVDDRGATVSLVGPQSAIGDAVDAYDDGGLAPDLRQLGEYRIDDGPLDALTVRQREVLEAAWDAGYYAVPREASTDDVAAALALDPSTVTEHLQRAERNLLGDLLEARE